MLKRRAKKRNALVLTFDDGPGSRITSSVLDILADYNVKASFFLLGRNIAGREEIVNEITASGHEVCSHGYNHLNYWKVSPFRALADIKRGWQTIDAALSTKRGKYPFRPPYGRLNLLCLLYLWIRRVPVVYWTFDLGDTWLSDKRDGQRIVELIKESGGAVVLAHDFDRLDRSVDNMVIESTRSVINMAKETSMQALTVSQLLCNRK